MSETPLNIKVQMLGRFEVIVGDRILRLSHAHQKVAVLQYLWCQEDLSCSISACASALFEGSEGTCRECLRTMKVAKRDAEDHMRVIGSDSAQEPHLNQLLRCLNFESDIISFAGKDIDVDFLRFRSAQPLEKLCLTNGPFLAQDEPRLKHLVWITRTRKDLNEQLLEACQSISILPGDEQRKLSDHAGDVLRNFLAFVTREPSALDDHTSQLLLSLLQIVSYSDSSSRGIRLALERSPDVVSKLGTQAIEFAKGRRAWGMDHVPTMVAASPGRSYPRWVQAVSLFTDAFTLEEAHGIVSHLVGCGVTPDDISSGIADGIVRKLKPNSFELCAQHRAPALTSLVQEGGTPGLRRMVRYAESSRIDACMNLVQAAIWQNRCGGPALRAVVLRWHDLGDLRFPGQAHERMLLLARTMALPMKVDSTRLSGLLLLVDYATQQRRFELAFHTLKLIRPHIREHGQALSLNGRRIIARYYTFMGHCWAEYGRPQRAKRYYQIAIDLIEAERLPRELEVLSYIKMNLALVSIDFGRPCEAIPKLDNLQRERMDDHSFQSAWRHNLASALMEDQSTDTDRIRELLQESLALRVGSLEEPVTLVELAQLEMIEGHHGEAKKLASLAEQMASDRAPGLTKPNLLLAMIALRIGNVDDAQGHLSAALTQTNSRSGTCRLSSLAEGTAEYLLFRGKAAEAALLLVRSDALWGSCSRTPMMAARRNELGLRIGEDGLRSQGSESTPGSVVVELLSGVQNALS